MMSAAPDVCEHKLERTRDTWLILACDGVWDVLSDQQVCEVVKQHASAKSAAEVSQWVPASLAHAHILASEQTPLDCPQPSMQAVCKQAHRRGSADNLTCCAVFFATPTAHSDPSRRATCENCPDVALA